MEYNLDLLKEKMAEYESNKITRKELGNWAEHVYYDILKSGLIYCKKLEIYPFVKEISTFHKACNDLEDMFPCTEERIEELKGMLLNGEKYRFPFVINLSGAIKSISTEECNAVERKKELLKKIKNIYRMRNCLCMSDGINRKESEIVTEILASNGSNATVFEIVEKQIQILMNCIYEINDSGLLHYRKKCALFTKTDSVMENNLVHYIDFYTGESSFVLVITDEDPSKWMIF